MDRIIHPQNPIGHKFAYLSNFVVLISKKERSCDKINKFHLFFNKKLLQVGIMLIKKIRSMSILTL